MFRYRINVTALHFLARSLIHVQETDFLIFNLTVKMDLVEVVYYLKLFQTGKQVFHLQCKLCHGCAMPADVSLHYSLP